MAYYDRQGCEIDVDEWLERSKNEKRVDRTDLADGKIVSTVWLGIDHSFGMGGPPIIFETLVFGPAFKGVLDGQRYESEDEARAGHAEMVAKWSLPSATESLADAEQVGLIGPIGAGE